MPRNEFNDVMQVLMRNQKKDFVRRILDPKNSPVLQNPDNTVSTHSMAWGEEDGKYFVYPTVQREGDRLKRFDDNEAWDRARKLGEYIEVDSPEQADWLSKRYKVVWEQ